MTDDNLAKYRALKNRTVAVVLAVSVTPLLIISVILFYYYDIVYRDKVIDHMEEVVERHRQTIDLFLSRNAKVIQMQLDSYNTKELENDEFLGERLRLLQKHYSQYFSDMGILDDKGVQVAYAGPFQLRNVDYSQADWFKEGKDKDVFISDVFLGVRRIPHFIVMSRRDVGGRVTYLRATIDFAAFNKLVHDIKIGRTGFAFIINRKGEFQTERRLDEAVNGNMLPAFLAQDYAADKVRWLRGGDAQGNMAFYVCTPLKNGEWILVYQQEVDDAMSAARNARNFAVIAISLGVLGIALTAMVLTRRAVGRISVAEQDQQVMHKQVLETSKLAAIGELAAGIAHEINNPVAIMVEEAGWIEDLMGAQDFGGDKNREEMSLALREIGVQGRRCKEITHKLLSFARRTDPRVQELDVNELVEEITGVSQQKARYQKVTLETDLAPDLPKVSMSPTELQQVLLNLINNAIDARNKEAGTVTVATRLDDGHVVIDVSDNGSGIPDSMRERIFEPFFTTKPVGKGTGLGLSICYGIICKLGGDITFESETGVGTVFHVRLPLGAPSGDNTEIRE